MNPKPHKLSIGLSESPEFSCHFREESPTHVFIDCFLYSYESQARFVLIEHYIPKKYNKTKKSLISLLKH